MHVGAGRSTDFIDLPIIRERMTGWPLVPGSSIKGVWRDYMTNHGVDKTTIATAFGQSADQDNDHSGSLAITDAHLLLLPVRSMYGTFAYTTSSLALRRLSQQMTAVGMKQNLPIPDHVKQTEVLTTKNSVVTSGNTGKVYMEDLDFQARVDASVDQWANWLGTQLFPLPEDTLFRQMLTERLLVVSDSSFDFLTKYATEVNARVRIDDTTKTVINGALWYDESLPAETVLVGLIWCDRVYGPAGVKQPDVLLQNLFGKPILCQMGGKATTGKGLVRSLFTRKDG